MQPMCDQYFQLINNNICYDKSLVSEHVSNYFTNVASTLVDQLPPSNGKYERQHLSNYSSKITGLDLLSLRFIKDRAKHIASPLTDILSVSLSTGEIPENLKSAKVVPIYKKNSKTEAGNYRPISILNTISK